LVIYTIPVDLPKLRQGLQSHAYRESDPGISWLRDLIIQAAAEMGNH